MTKYKAAAEIANSELRTSRGAAQPRTLLGQSRTGNSPQPRHPGLLQLPTLICNPCAERAATHLCAEAIAAVIDACKGGARLVDLCNLGDAAIAK